MFLGDSGGPLVCKEGRKWVLRGIISWGSMKCDGREAYSVFTRVSHYLHWIYFSRVVPPRPHPRKYSNLSDRAFQPYACDNFPLTQDFFLEYNFVGRPYKRCIQSLCL